MYLHCVSTPKGRIVEKGESSFPCRRLYSSNLIECQFLFSYGGYFSMYQLIRLFQKGWSVRSEPGLFITWRCNNFLIWWDVFTLVRLDKLSGFFLLLMGNNDGWRQKMKTKLNDWVSIYLITKILSTAPLNSYEILL